MNIIDSLTRAPTKTVVQSASQLGEKAAHVLGTYVDDSMKNISDDLTTAIDKVSDKIGQKLDVFGVKLKETGVEGLTEVGIALERAFLHLGQKLETGVTNAGTRLAHGLDHSLSAGFEEINSAVGDVSRDVSAGFATLGNPQIDHIKKIFDKELGTIMKCLYLITFTVCACVFLVILYMTNALKLIFQFLPFSTLILFGVVNGIAIYKYKEPFLSGKKLSKNNSKPEEKLEEKEPEKPESDKKSKKEKTKKKELSIDNLIDLKDLKENIISVFDDKDKNIDTPLFLVLIIFSFIAGIIAKEILIFNFISITLQLLILIFITLLMYKSLCFQLFFKAYKIWKLILEFYEWKNYKNGVINVVPPVVSNIAQNASRNEMTKSKHELLEVSSNSPAISPFSPSLESDMQQLEIIESEILNDESAAITTTTSTILDKSSQKLPATQTSEEKSLKNQQQEGTLKKEEKIEVSLSVEQQNSKKDGKEIENSNNPPSATSTSDTNSNTNSAENSEVFSDVNFKNNPNNGESGFFSTIDKISGESEFPDLITSTSTEKPKNAVILDEEENENENEQEKEKIQEDDPEKQKEMK